MMGRILSADSFTAVATEGLGRKSLGTAGSIAFFRDGIFVGTSCTNPAVADDAPRIVRYDVKNGTWTTVYELPLIESQPRLRVRERQSAEESVPSGQHGRRRGGGTGEAGAKIPA